MFKEVKRMSHYLLPLPGAMDNVVMSRLFQTDEVDLVLTPSQGPVRFDIPERHGFILNPLHENVRSPHG